MNTRVYTRNLNGELKKFDVDGKITHKQAVSSLKAMGFKYKGAVLLVYMA